jgi:hypothetical protein
VPYLQKTRSEAVPQYISGRTSYLRVRLAFHLYPQLIQRLCTVKWFGPSSAVKRTSPWPWVAHTVSGRIPATFRRSGYALFGLAFAMAPQVSLLNQATEIHSLAHSSIGTPLSLRRETPTVCRHAVSGSFNSPPGVLFHLSLTVLLHYRSLRVFSLGKWSHQFPTGFLVSRGTQGHKQGRRSLFRLRGCHSLRRPFPGSFC